MSINSKMNKLIFFIYLQNGMHSEQRLPPGYMNEYNKYNVKQSQSQRNSKLISNLDGVGIAPVRSICP